MIARLKSVTSHSGFRRYGANTAWVFGEKIFRMIVSLFVGVWVARYLGPEQYGLLSYVQSFVGLFVALAALGLDGIVIRDLVKDPTKRDVLIGTAFWLKLSGSLVILPILAIAIQLTSNDNYTNLLIFIVASATVIQSFSVIDFYFQSKVLSKYVVYSSTISLFISSIIKIALILTKAPLILFAWLIAFDSLIITIGYLYFYSQNNLSLKNWHFDKQIAINLLQESWPYILSSMVISFYMKIDQIMIKEMMSAEAVGQYAAAVRISEAWYFIPGVLATSLFPAIINAKAQSSTLYNLRLQKLYNFTVWISIAIALPMTFLSNWIINLLYGNAYYQSGTILMIHIWTGVFISLSIVSGKWYINEQFAQLALYRNISGAVVNIILNILLIPHYGIVGVAFATLVSYAMASYLFDLFNQKTRDVFYQKTKSLIFYNLYKGYK